MIEHAADRLSHPVLTRRTALEAGAIGLLGLGTAELQQLRSLAAPGKARPAKSVIFVFLTGGIAQHDSFDPKPDAPADVRGEFQPIATRTPGIDICEHLPMLAQQSDQWALVRSIGTENAGHEVACHMLLTGRLDLPPGFNTNIVPSPNEWPSIPSLVTYAAGGRNNLPPAVVLPQPSVNEVGRVRPGQYAGKLGPRWEAWHVDIAAHCPLGNGACPDCFRFDGSEFHHASKTVFNTPVLTLPDGGRGRLKNRLSLLDGVERQRQDLDRIAEVDKLGRQREQALSVLTDPTTSNAFDVENADPKTLARYGKNKFGLSLLMARRLVEAGVKLVQVNLGKNSSWDTHARNFVNLRDNLLPPTDRAVSALIDDLTQSGLLDETLVIVTGEFGRTPKINKNAGRDHWAQVMTSLFVGGGVRGGNVIGASDALGANPLYDKQTPENMAATIYEALGIPRTAVWTDTDRREHEFYRGRPIDGLM